MQKWMQEFKGALMTVLPIFLTELYLHLGQDGVHLFIDIRDSASCNAPQTLIPGALRHLATDFPAANGLLPNDRDLVLYFSLRSKLSQSTLQQLRNQGFNTSSLDSCLGAWEAGGLPTMGRTEKLCPSPSGIH